MLLKVHWQCPIFPDRLQSSIFGDEKLNFCVRDGNRWFLLSMVTSTGIINNFSVMNYRTHFDN